MAKQKMVSVCISNIFSFSIFFGFSIFFFFSLFGNIHTFPIKKYVWRKYGLFFSFLSDHQNKKYKRKFLCKFWLFQGEQSFKFFPYFSFKNLRSKGREYLTAFAFIFYWS
jgi:hypothetical protein